MDFVNRPGRWYKRYKHENKYDSPLLIYIIDASIGLTKLVLLVALFAGIWSQIAKYIDAEPTGIAATEIEHEVLASSTPTSVVTQSLTSESGENAASIANTSETATRRLIPAAASPVEIYDEDWILGIRPSSYVIQFGSSENIAFFDNFVPVINYGEPIAIYPYNFTPEGNPIYGIASGIYTNRAAALAAVENFSEQARAYKPWVRKVADLTTEIESALKKLQAL